MEEETIEEGSDSESDSSSSSSDSNNEESESVIESNIEAEEDEDFYNLDEVDVPEIMRSQSFTPKIVDEKEKLIPKTEELLGESMKLIDTNVHMQIFCGPSSEERDELNIKRVKQLGGGAQADVYQVRVVGLKGKFVDKTRKIYNNLELAEKTMKEMFAAVATPANLKRMVAVPEAGNHVLASPIQSNDIVTVEKETALFLEQIMKLKK